MNPVAVVIVVTQYPKYDVLLPLSSMLGQFVSFPGTVCTISSIFVSSELDSQICTEKQNDCRLERPTMIGECGC